MIRNGEEKGACYAHEREKIAQDLVKVIERLPTGVLVDVTVVIKALGRNVDCSCESSNLQLPLLGAHEMITGFEAIITR